jgi:hypothetical protein
MLGNYQVTTPLVASRVVLSSIELVIYVFILTAYGILPGGNGATIRHNTQTRHHTKLHKQ